MNDTIKLLDVIALTADVPGRGLRGGQVGTVVESLAPDVWQVKVSDNDGRTCAMAPLQSSQLLVLRHEPARRI